MVLFSKLLSEEQSLRNKIKNINIRYNDFEAARLNTLNSDWGEVWKFEEILIWYAHQTGKMILDEIEYKDRSIVNFISKTFTGNLKGLPLPCGSNLREQVTISYKESKFTTFDMFLEPMLRKFDAREKLVYIEYAEKLKKTKKLFSNDVETLTENLITARLRISYSGMLKEAYARDIILSHPKFVKGEYVLWEPDSRGDSQLKVDYFIKKATEDVWVFLGVTGQSKPSTSYPRNCDVVIQSGSSFKNGSFEIVDSVYFPTIQNIYNAIEEIKIFKS